MKNQKELARAFARGSDSGRASNMSIQTGDDGETHLVGYGWAVYATHYPSGRMDYYGPGWSEWSREKGGNATQSQLAEVRKGIRAALGGVSLEDHALATIVEGETPTVAEPPETVSMVGERVRDRGRGTVRF